MFRKNVTDSRKHHLENARASVERISACRRSLLINFMLFFIPLAISYLLLIFCVDGGLLAYMEKSLEHRIRFDLTSVVIAIAIYFISHAIMQFTQNSAEDQVKRAEIDLECQGEDVDTPEEWDAICMRYQKAYYDTVFRHAQQSYVVTYSMSILGPMILLLGIVLSFLDLMNPAWLPLAYAVVLDLMILIHKLYYSDAMKFVKDDHEHFRKRLDAAHVIKLAMEKTNDKESLQLLQKAVDYILESDSAGESPNKAMKDTEKKTAAEKKTTSTAKVRKQKSK